MKKLTILLFSICLCLVGCSKTINTTDTENTEQEVLLVADDKEKETEEKEEKTLEEQLGIEEIEGLELVGVEVDGVEVELSEYTEREDVVHETIEGGSDIVVSIGDVPEMSKDYFNHFELMDPKDDRNQANVLYPEELELSHERIDMFRDDNCFNHNDIAMMHAFFTRCANMISDTKDGQYVYRVSIPVTKYDNIQIKVLAQGVEQVINGDYESLYLHPIFVNGTFREFTMEYYDNVYKASGPITASEFEQKYMPYCELVEGYYDNYYVIKDNIKECKGSITYFVELDTGMYLPVGYGSKVEPLTEQSDLAMMCETIMNFAESVEYDYTRIIPSF